MENKMNLINVSGGFNCSLNNYGSMRDTLANFDYNFSNGLYILEGECATGGWALSSVLAGKEKKDRGEIILNGMKMTREELKKKVCYVGEDAGLKKQLGTISMSVSEQIEYGIKKGLGFENNIEDIKKKFGLSDERFNRKIKYFSGERWRASLAIGYSMGKIVYCFPWLNQHYLSKLEEMLKQIFPLLIDKGAIIILPTTYAGSVDNIYEHYITIDMQNREEHG